MTAIRRQGVSAGVMMVFVAAAGANPIAATASPLRLAAIVPDYMPGDLETAITPTPQQADLLDTAFLVKTIGVILPAGQDYPGTLVRELEKRVPEGTVTVIDPAAGEPVAADTRIFIGRQADSAAWQAVVKRAGLEARMRELDALGEDAYGLHASGDNNVVLLAGNSHAAPRRG